MKLFSSCGALISRRTLSFLVLLVAAVLPVRPGNTTMAASLLSTLEVPEGWTLSGDIRTFTQSELYGHIDGGAELFLEFGFERLEVAHYRYAQNELSMESYRMTDPAGALGIFQLKRGRESADPGFAEQHTVNVYQLTFWRANYFVIVANPKGNEALRSSMVAFASSLVARLPQNPAVNYFAQLPRKGLVPRSERLIRGPFALQSLYTLGDGDILSMGAHHVTAVAGQYEQEGKMPLTVVVAPYPDEKVATEALRYLCGHLDTYLEKVGCNENRLVFRDHASRYGQITREGAVLRIELNRVAAPDVAPGPVSPSSPSPTSGSVSATAPEPAPINPAGE